MFYTPSDLKVEHSPPASAAKEPFPVCVAVSQ